ncbi:MAG TPA: ABC transporter permease [Chitinophagaceae bacterium]|jgi:ABC-type antimicrobial peptide transport system permease subunit|nr:ABC transporter permease [Chitinophagaceae bacterium]
MIKNYFKIAWRNLFRNKGFSLTNLLGLTIGITCTILIFLWVQDELHYDKFHANYNSIYKIKANRDFNNQVFTDDNMVLPLAKTLQEKLPQIKKAVVTTHRQPHILTYGEAKLKKQGYTVSEHFFDMFSWKFIRGNAATALPDAYSIVLTKSASIALFGNEDPINKIIKVDNEYDAKVTAIVADVPGNSSFQFDFINAFNYSNDYLKQAMTNWQNSSWDVFIQPNPGTNMRALEKNINQIKYQHDPDDKKISTYFGFPMNKWRLYSEFKNGKNIGGMIEYVTLFTIIALIILLIACVNFMNLSTARSEKRAKEVGVRKTLGSGKKQLVLQFFLESLILAFVAFIFSIGIVYLLLPSFNILVDKHLTLPFAEPIFWLGAAAIIVFTGIIAGSYPALYLSSFNPIKVLKGTFLAGKSAAMPRRILVVAQFVTSILLISATIIIYQQIQHIKNRNIGYDPNNLIMIYATPDTQKNFAVIKQELLSTGLINSVVRTFSPITDIWWKTPAPDWEGKPANLNIIFAGMATDIDFTKTLGIKMLQGKDFSGTPSDSSAMLLNKAAVEAMGLKNPVGMQMRYGKTYTVTGVTDNVIMESPFKPVDPMMVFFDPNNSNAINIRLNQTAEIQKALNSIETIFKKYNPAYPFEYQFVDKEYGKKFLTEELISKITNIFAALAIFICCIGLAGLASFTIEKRIREIGIRKVLGATVQQLLLLISKEFLKLVLIAFVIAAPLTWWFMNNWLEKYTYRIQISIWLFGAVGIMVLLLTLVVVSLNTMRAAIANPVKSLRTE